MSRVSTKVGSDLSTDEMRKKYPESARVTLILKDGRKFEGLCGEAYGMPGRPLSDADLTRKFCGCLDYAGLSFDTASEIAAEILAQDFCSSDKSITEIIGKAWSYLNLDPIDKEDDGFGRGIHLLDHRF